MALTLLVYKGDEVVKRQEASTEGKTTATITGLESNTKYNEGDYKVAWTNGKLESGKVNVPSFTTQKIGVKIVNATPESTTLDVGDTAQIEYEVSPKTADDQSVTYLSNNQPVATVTQDGLIQAVSKGQATITVKSNDNTSATAKIKVTVNELPQEEPEEAPEETEGTSEESPGEVVDEPDTAVEEQPEATDSEPEATEENPDTVSDNGDTSVGGETEETVNDTDDSREEDQTL